MMSSATGINTIIIGLSLLGFSTILQLVCLFLVRILTHTKHGGHISTIRMWLHISAAFEQLSFLAFHTKYHFFDTDLNISDECIVLRFLSSVSSTLTNMWLLVIASFYLMLTIKPAKCFTFHSRFLSHCVTWTWTNVSCLMYLMLSFLLKEEYHHSYYTRYCWDNISNTMHMYLTYGNEFIPFVFTSIFLGCARCRVSIRRELLRCFTEQSEYDIDIKCITHTISRMLILFAFLAIYYSSIVFRILLDEKGSDWILMIMQSGKGIAIATLVCFLSDDIISLVRCRRGDSKPNSRNGYTAATKVTNMKFSENAIEMETLTLE